jgi:hypothetical protein
MMVILHAFAWIMSYEDCLNNLLASTIISGCGAVMFLIAMYFWTNDVKWQPIDLQCVAYKYLTRLYIAVMLIATFAVLMLYAYGAICNMTIPILIMSLVNILWMMAMAVAIIYEKKLVG